ncbi:MAG: hypothetical protein IIA87_00650 [Nanoarchaeota archaeon]|nr:hypothetical protein [Nanoarchaeota archaeon]
MIHTKKLVMNKQAKNALLGVLIFGVTLSILFLMSFVLAVHQVSFEDWRADVDISAFGIDEDTYVVINVTVNDTDTGSLANITQVNITFPAGFIIASTFDLNSNNTDAVAVNTKTVGISFTNTTLGGRFVFSWENLTGGVIQNSTSLTHFLFNVTSAKPGKFNITVRTLNFSTFIETNLTIVINDTTIPANKTFESARSFGAGSNNSLNHISINLSVGDNAFADTVRFFLWNSTNDVINQTNITVDGRGRFAWINISTVSDNSSQGISDGTYRINATANDTTGNDNVTSVNGVSRTIIIDTVAPEITLTKSSSSDKNKLVIDIAITDSTSGVNGIACTATGGGTGNIAIGGGSDTSQTATQEGLSCSSSNVYTIKCKDHAGNTGSKEGTFSTDSCSGGGSPGGSGPGPGGSQWITTFIEDDEPLETRGSITKELAERHRVKINVVGVVHYVGILADGLTGTSVTIQVSSSHEQESTLNIGETAKVDVSDPIDNVYDLSVTLNSIESNKASITILPIQESYTLEEEEAAPEEVEEGPPALGPEELAAAPRSLAWLWILIVVIGIVVVVWVVVRKRQVAK